MMKVYHVVLKILLLEVNVETKDDPLKIRNYEIINRKGDTYNAIKLIEDDREVAFSSVVTN